MSKPKDDSPSKAWLDENTELITCEQVVSLEYIHHSVVDKQSVSNLVKKQLCERIIEYLMARMNIECDRQLAHDNLIFRASIRFLKPKEIKL